jgi:hypothetical protein
VHPFSSASLVFENRASDTLYQPFSLHSCCFACDNISASTVASASTAPSILTGTSAISTHICLLFPQHRLPSLSSSIMTCGKPNCKDLGCKNSVEHGDCKCSGECTCGATKGACGCDKTKLSKCDKKGCESAACGCKVDHSGCACVGKCTCGKAAGCVC